jgi:hypothetical protein
VCNDEAERHRVQYAQLQLSAAINDEHQHFNRLRKEEKERLEQEGKEKLEREREKLAKDKLARDKRERGERERLERERVDLEEQLEKLTIGSPEHGHIVKLVVQNQLATSPTATTGAAFALKEKCHECKGTKEMAKWVY